MNLKMIARKSAVAVAGITLGLLPLTAAAAPVKAPHATPAKKTAATALYECTQCHMRVDAATAKKDHYKDPMDGGALVPVKAAKK